jgi:hypothetical protein
MPYFIGPEILLEARTFNDLRTTAFRHLREQFGKLCKGEAVAEGFQFQDHYFSEDCIGDSIKNSSSFPSPERYAFSKIKLILWWPEGRVPWRNYDVCCPECHQYHHLGWMDGHCKGGCHGGGCISAPWQELPVRCGRLQDKVLQQPEFSGTESASVLHPKPAANLPHREKWHREVSLLSILHGCWLFILHDCLC